MFSKCRECAAKHLRAALAYAALEPRLDETYVVGSPTALTEASRAAVLFGEAHAYPAHRDLALGFLSVAEDLAEGTPAAGVLRDVRLGDSSASLLCERAGSLVNWFVGHLVEARREGGIALPDVASPRWLESNFDRLIKEAETPAPEERKEGEKDMATTKKACGKGGKALMAASKGGKTACKAGKAACKGKKCK